MTFDTVLLSSGGLQRSAVVPSIQPSNDLSRGVRIAFELQCDRPAFSFHVVSEFSRDILEFLRDILFV
jgi:hypothetical protein